MAKRLFRKYWSCIKEYLQPLNVSNHTPRLEMSSKEVARMNVEKEHSFTLKRTDEEIEKINNYRIEKAKLDQERESTNLNLIAQHRLMITTLIAAFIALFAALSAIYISLYS